MCQEGQQEVGAPQLIAAASHGCLCRERRQREQPGAQLAPPRRHCILGQLVERILPCSVLRVAQPAGASASAEAAAVTEGR